MSKIIFVTGGVLSGLGKGVTAASIGAILKARGYKVSIQKLDQYINVDAGTLNPHEHGEVYVTEDGAETDLDLGHYERFVDITLNKESSVMTGAIYNSVITKERSGEMLGQTVQVIPHITNECKKRVLDAAKKYGSDIHIVEIGGTIGDYEGSHFVEAARQMRQDLGEHNVLYVHVVFLPYLVASNEIKTKPAQNSVRDLKGLGIQPHVICCRSDYPVGREQIKKLSLFCDVPEKAIIPLVTAETIYEVPTFLEECDLGQTICSLLQLDQTAKPNLTEWYNLVATIKAEKPKLKIALVGKYMGMKDTYMSVTEALRAAGWAYNRDITIKWVDSEQLEKEGTNLLSDVSGIIIPGGFGSRGIEGKISAANFARTHKIPYFGLCLGMQIATIEFARYALGTNNVTSEEFDPTTKNPVIHIMEHQKNVSTKGGTMRLGSYTCVLNPNSTSARAYGAKEITERHRHRFEFNNDYKQILTEKGLVIAGTSPDQTLTEIIEITDHPFYVGVQFHPEFLSRPLRPHPLFKAFIEACIKTSTLV